MTRKELILESAIKNLSSILSSGIVGCVPPEQVAHYAVSCAIELSKELGVYDNMFEE